MTTSLEQLFEQLRTELEQKQSLEAEVSNLRAKNKALQSLIPENESLRAKLAATEKLARVNYQAGLSRGFCERQAADLELKLADEQIGQAVTDGLIEQGNGLDKDF